MLISAPVLLVSITRDIVSFPWLITRTAEILRYYCKKDLKEKKKIIMDDSY